MVKFVTIKLAEKRAVGTSQKEVSIYLSRLARRNRGGGQEGRSILEQLKNPGSKHDSTLSSIRQLATDFDGFSYNENLKLFEAGSFEQHSSLIDE